MADIASPAGALPDAHDDAAADRTYTKIMLRVVPIVVLAYVLAYIDRVNIGFAKLQFLHDLGFSEAAYGLGAGLFFIGYAIFEVPSNLYMDRVGARKTIARIMMLWGALSAGLAFVQTPMQFYVMRFALGAAEAGLFPGVILYLGYWFPPARRGRMTSLFTMGAPAAGIFGSPLSGWLMSQDGLHGLRGWQVLLIYEGLPTVLLGVFALFYMDDKPETARWLSRSEKDLVARDIASGRTDGGHRSAGLREMLRNPILYVLAVAYFGGFSATSTVALWAPSIIKAQGVGTAMVGVLTAIPFLFAAAAMYLVARSSDRFFERKWHYGVSICCSGASLALLALGDGSPAVTTALLVLAAAGAAGQVPVFWTIPPAYLSGSAKAAGIAFISSVGSIGGFVSPLIVGGTASATGSLYAGLAAVGVMIIAAASLLLVFVRADVLR